MSPRRRHRAFSISRLIRAVAAIVVAAGLIGALALGAAILLIDPNAYKPAIEAAAWRATGRTLALRGPLRLAPGLPPRLIAEDVTLANPPGLSRPEMLHLDRAEASIAPWPLLRGEIDIDDLTLIHPDVRLERGADRRGNWLFAHPTRPAGAESSPAVAPSALAAAVARPSRSRAAPRSIHIVEGRIGWQGAPDAPGLDLLLPRVDAVASGPAGTLVLGGALGIQGRTLTLDGEIGALEPLFDRGAQAPWPVQVSLRDGGARFSVAGSIARPIGGKGMLLRFDASVSDFTGLEALLPPGVAAPADVTATVHWGDGEVASDAALTGLALHIGAMRLPALLPGVDIARIDVAAPALDRPVHVEMQGNEAKAGALRLVATFATLKSLLPGAGAADQVPVEMTLDAGRARISAKGTVTGPVPPRAIDLDVAARLPDLAAFGTLAGRRLPPLVDVAFQGHVTGAPGSAGAIGVRDATLTLPGADVSGEADFRPGPRPDVRAVLSSRHIDMDALLAELSPPAPAADPAGGAPPPASAPAAPAAPARWLIPDGPLDLGALDRFDAGIQFHIDSLRLGGADDGQVIGAVALRDGALVVDPLSGLVPGGTAEGRLSVDSRAAEMPVSLSLRAPSLPLALVAPLLGDRAAAAGTVAVDADLHGAGRSPHAIAASLTGHVGLASTDAEVDNRIILALMKAVKLPAVPLAPAGTTKPRCMLLRLGITRGVATVDALMADLQLLVVLGGGTLDLGREEFALQFRPMLRLGGGGGVVVPVRVGGSFLLPKVGVGVETRGGPPIAGVGAPDPCAAGLKLVFPAPQDSAAPAIAVPAPAPLKSPAGGVSALDVLKGLIK